jgi:hypothetical protein
MLPVLPTQRPASAAAQSTSSSLVSFSQKPVSNNNSNNSNNKHHSQKLQRQNNSDSSRRPLTSSSISTSASASATHGNNGRHRQPASKNAAVPAVTTVEQPLSFAAQADRLAHRPKAWLRSLHDCDEGHYATPTAPVPSTTNLPPSSSTSSSLSFPSLSLPSSLPLSTGWSAVTIRAEDVDRLRPSAPLPATLLPYSGKRADLCLFCAAVVPVGAQLIHCRTCSSLAHASCIARSEQFRRPDTMHHLPRCDSTDWSAWMEMNNSTDNYLTTNNDHAMNDDNNNNQLQQKQWITRSISRDTWQSPSFDADEDSAVGGDRALTVAVGAQRRRSMVRMRADSFSSRNSPPARTTSPTAAAVWASSSSVSLRNRPATATAAADALDRRRQTGPPLSPIRVSDPHTAYLAREMGHWQCHFCLYEHRSYNDVLQEQFRQAKLQHKQLKSLLTIQSFMRMLPFRLRFRRFKRGIHVFQQWLRERWKRRIVELEYLNQKYAYRIRLNDLKMIVKVSSNNSSNSGNNTVHNVVEFPSLSHPNSIGNISCERYEKHVLRCKAITAAVDNHCRNSHQSNNKTSNNSNNSSSNNNSHNPSHDQAVDANEPTRFLDFLAMGPQETSSYAKSVSGGQNVSRGSYFLTVTLCHPDDGNQPHHPQYLRYDLQLKETGVVKDLTTRKLAAMGYNLKHHSGAEWKQILDRHQIVHLSVVNPYLLIPFTSAMVELRLTVSQVKDWPKSVVCGQAVHSLRSFLLGKRVASFHQTVEPVVRELLLPTNDDGELLKISLPLTAKSSTSSSLSSYKGSVPSKGRPPLHMDMSSPAIQRKEIPNAFAQMFVTWTVLPVSTADHNHYGPLTMGLIPPLRSTDRKEYWCVLIDGCVASYK